MTTYVHLVTAYFVITNHSPRLQFLRGVSGGEKRRVTIGVDWMKNPAVMLLDEPTTGLDAGAALSVGRVLRNVSRFGVPVLCALLQPGNELLESFDKLILLVKGQIAYWGPVGVRLY